MRILIVILSGCLLSPLAAFAWNSTGHQMTATIAFQRLSPDERNRFAEILRAHPRYRQDFAAAMPREVRRGTASEQALWLFQRASYWPDIVPGVSDAVREEFHRGTWHYINLSVYLTAADKTALKDTLEHNMSTEFSPPLAAGMNVIQALAGNLRVWQDPAAAEADRAVALCWIIHLTGDLHQPLHTVALFSRDYFPAGDRGGNSIRIEASPEPGNLHRVWDSLPDGFSDLEPAQDTARMLASESVTVDSPRAWLQRHFQLAQDYVYTETLKEDLARVLAHDPEAAISLPPAYLDAAAKVGKEQVILAGHRIAALLTL